MTFAFIHILFYLFSAIAIGSGCMVIASPNPVRAALCLVFTFFAMAGIWLLLEAEFLSLVLVLVYVGAVMTLFLFVIMMLRVNTVSLREGWVRYFVIGILSVVGVVSLMIGTMNMAHFNLMHTFSSSNEISIPNTTQLGLVLYTDYAYPVEIAAVLLLTAMVAAISLMYKEPRARKVQQSSRQIHISRQDRIRIVDLPTEKKIKITKTDKPI